MVFMSAGFPALKDHFKKIDGYADRHSMPNIDFIYLINLDQRPEKWEASLAELMRYGIEPYRFSAVNGWELPFEVIQDVGLKFKKGMKEGVTGNCYHLDANKQLYHTHETINKYGQTYFTYGMARGTIGITLSHLSILQDAYDRGYETIWVMEDDIEAVQDPRIISELVEKLDKLVGEHNWDILFTDQDTRGADGKYIRNYGAERPDIAFDKAKFKTRKNIGKFRKIGARFGAYSMILRRSGMKKILNFYNKHNIFLPFDFEYSFPDNIALYTVQDDVVRHRLDAQSDNGGPNYKMNK